LLHLVGFSFTYLLTEHVKFMLMVFMLTDNVTEKLLVCRNACKTFV